MNKQDSGKFLSKALGLAYLYSGFSRMMGIGEQKGSAAPAPYKKRRRGGSGMSGIATIQGIRIAENRKQRIKGKQRKAAKRLLLIKRKLKQESAIC